MAEEDSVDQKNDDTYNFPTTAFATASLDQPFRGLANQGATCYLNSYIQTLFMTPEIREAVYKFQQGSGSAKYSIVLQLQRLFARLQTGFIGAPSTKDLTTSFGWEGREAFRQHDVQEFIQKLHEALAVASKGTELGDTLRTMSHGLEENYTTCQGCSITSKRPTPFLTLGLPVKGWGTLENALKGYTVPDALEGVNAYNCSNCKSKQTAQRGVRFRSFPYLLTIQLLRFDMNWQTGQRIKLGHRLRFPRMLDLSELLSQKSPEIFECYSVLVHHGSPLSGHYFAYIKDFETGKWHIFNDSRVTPCSEKEEEELFGKEASSPKDPAADGREDKEDSKLKPQPPPSQSSSSIPSAPPPNPAPLPPPPPAPPTPFASTTAGAPALPSALTVAEASPPSLLSGVHAVSSQLAQQDEAMQGSGPQHNAYMLLYRRVDAPRNVQTVSRSKIPPELLQEMEEEKKQFDEELIRWKHEQTLQTFRLFHFVSATDTASSVSSSSSPSSSTASSSDLVIKLKIKKTDTVHDLVVKAFHALGTDKVGASLENTRLREFDEDKWRALKPLAERDTSSAEPLQIEALDLVPWQAICIETRQPGEAWAVFSPPTLPLQLVTLDETAATPTLKEPVLLKVPETAKLQELRELVAATQGWESSHTRLYSQNKQSSLAGDIQILQANNFLVFKGIGLKENETVYGEVVDPLHGVGTSILVKKLEDDAHLIMIAFNVPDDETQTHIITIDEREPLQSLRKGIAEKLKLEQDSFKLRKSRGGPELKDGEKTLDRYNLRDLKEVHVEMGTPLQVGQYLLKIYLHSPKLDEKAKEQALPGEDDVIFLGDVVMDENWSFQRVTEELARLPGSPKPNLMRLRDRLNGVFTRVYLHELVLKKNCIGLEDCRAIYIQPLTIPETITKSSILLNLCQWIPSRRKLTQPEEVPFLAKTTIMELKTEIAKRYLKAQDPAFIRVVYAQPADLRDLDHIADLPWHEPKLKGSTPLSGKGGSVWRARHGDTIVFKSIEGGAGETGGDHADNAKSVKKQSNQGQGCNRQGSGWWRSAQTRTAPLHKFRARARRCQTTWMLSVAQIDVVQLLTVAVASPPPPLAETHSSPRGALKRAISATGPGVSCLVTLTQMSIPQICIFSTSFSVSSPSNRTKWAGCNFFPCQMGSHSPSTAPFRVLLFHSGP
eukprot:g78194.t1